MTLERWRITGEQLVQTGVMTAVGTVEDAFLKVDSAPH